MGGQVASEATTSFGFAESAAEAEKAAATKTAVNKTLRISDERIMYELLAKSKNKM